MGAPSVGDQWGEILGRGSVRGPMLQSRHVTTERAATTTILFSDLVGSTELLDRAGDEDAQRLFKAHYQLLRDAVSQHGGAEVKSLGDGLMVAFASAADAVRCAIAMQQMSRRPVNGEHLAIRVGLNAGDALRDEGDYFGTAVVAARRLCDRARPGPDPLQRGRRRSARRPPGVLVPRPSASSSSRGCRRPSLRARCRTKPNSRA